MESYFFKVKKRLILFWQRWGGKVSLSICDQIIFSAANFILNIFLIRWLGPSEYGIFVIAFSVFLFFTGLYQALILEPVSVLGAANYSDNFGRYVGVSVWLHAGVTLLFSVVILLIAIGMAIGNSSFASSFFGLVIVTPFILFFWLFRQVCYVQMKPRISLRGSVAYAFILFLLLFVVHGRGWLSPFSALIVMGIASLSAALLFWPFLGISLENIFWSKAKGDIKKILIENWHYGKWVAGSAFVHWLSIYVYLPLIGVFTGVIQVGTFRAMQNFMFPLQRAQSALSLLFLPWFSKQSSIQGRSYLKQALKKLFALNIITSCVYVVGVIALGGFFVKVLYADDYYLKFIWLLPCLGVAAIVESVAHVFYVGLKASKRPDANFWAQTVGVVFTLTAGIYFVFKFKLQGAVLAYLLTTVVVTATLIYFFVREINRSD